MLAVLLCAAALPWGMRAQGGIDCTVSLTGNVSSGEFAPYYIGSLNHGKITGKSTALADIAVSREMDTDSRLSWGFGAEVIADVASPTTYLRWDEGTAEMVDNRQRPPALWLQQMYAEVKYRSLFIEAGLKEHTPALVNPELSSGDFIESGNSRPIPEIRGGLHDFVDIPLTNGWVQMQTQLAYGKMTDDGYLRSRFNYYNGHIGSGAWYTYKFFFFRTNPDQRFMATVGMQSASIFGGKADYYSKGVMIGSNEYASGVSAFLKMLIPVLSNDEDFAPGSTIGSWDFYGQYMLGDGSELAAYFQWPFEDGSGIARRNKLDGIWGLEWRNSNVESAVSEVVVEYIDFRDQSGPIHFAPADHTSPTITNGVSGRDNYYNNSYYNSYANYGMSIGTPVMLSPIYNLDGNIAFACNRVNGFHLGLKGYLRYNMPYRLLLGYQRGLGTYSVPYTHVRTNTSIMAECAYMCGSHIDLRLQLALDRGKLRGDNCGALFSITYHIGSM